MVVFLNVVLVYALIVASVQGSLYNFFGDNIGPSADSADEYNTQSEELVKAENPIVPEVEIPELQILPLSKPIGQVAGLAVTPEGKLLAFHRGDRVWNEFSFGEDFKFNKSLDVIKNSTFYLINPSSGAVESENGANLFYMPHGLTVDKKGNIWVTDVARHQVIKMDSKYKVLMELGEKMIPGNDEKHFCQPTDVAVASNGHFFVSDGYCNSRVMKFDENGKLLTTFGAPTEGTPAEDGQFFVPHSLALIEDLNLICVADRENERVQCFSAGISEGHRQTIPAGMFVTKAENIGRVYAIRENKHYLIGATGADFDGQIEPQVFVMDIQTGKASTFAKGIENAHSLAVGDDGQVFIGQIGPNQIVKMSLNDPE